MKICLLKSLFIISGLLLLSDPVYSQRYPRNIFELAGGFGWPEMGALKLKYGKNFQIGLSQGFMLNTSVEIYYHFAGKTKFTDRKIWYGLGGLERLYWGEEEPNWFPYLRVGRCFYVSRKNGLNLDIGSFYLLHKSHFFSSSRFSPSGSITYFFKF
jgi:hypothetical protein